MDVILSVKQGGRPPADGRDGVCGAQRTKHLRPTRAEKGKIMPAPPPVGGRRFPGVVCTSVRASSLPNGWHLADLCKRLLHDHLRERARAGRWTRGRSKRRHSRRSVGNSGGVSLTPAARTARRRV